MVDTSKKSKKKGKKRAEKKIVGKVIDLGFEKKINSRKLQQFEQDMMDHIHIHFKPELSFKLI